MSKSEQELNKINAGLSKSDKFLESMAQKAQTIFNSLRAGSSAMSGTGASNSVMDTPFFANAQQTTGPSPAVGPSHKIMDTPSYSVGPITMGGPIYPGGPMPPTGVAGATGPSFGQQVGQGIINYGLPALGLAYGSLPSVSQGMEQQLLTTRARFYSGMSEEDMLRRQRQMAMQGTITDPMSPTRMDMIAQSGGISPGLANYEQITSGVADFSNLVPGMDVTGGMQAAIALNQARNVNMLKLIGVNVRDPSSGLMNNPREVVDQLWNRLTAGRRPPTREEIAFSLQPGNRLDLILNTYFGNSPELKTAAIAHFYQKAAGGNLSLESRLDTGVTTEGVEAVSNRNAAALGIIQTTADESVAGATAGNRLITSISDLIVSNDALRNAIEFLSGARGFLDTIATTPIGAAATSLGSNLVVRGLQSIFKIPGKQVGGRAQAGKPVLVGEQGPEILVPDQASIVIPNSVTIKDGLDENEWAIAFLHNIKAPSTKDNITAIRNWMAGEGGHYSSKGTHKARYNPLNTTLPTSTSRPMSEKNQRVQAYNSWEEGLYATISTLIGKNADARGYSDIIGALQAGRPLNEIYNTIKASHWVGGSKGSHGYNFGNTGDAVYRGGLTTKLSLAGIGSSSSGEYGGSAYAGSGGVSSGSFLSDLRRSGSNLFASQYAPGVQGSQQSSSGDSINYGGVNVTINVPPGSNINPSELAAQVKNALGNDNIMSQLGAS
jgi:hypothetical protein